MSYVIVIIEINGINFLKIVADNFVIDYNFITDHNFILIDEWFVDI